MTVADAAHLGMGVHMSVGHGTWTCWTLPKGGTSYKPKMVPWWCCSASARPRLPPSRKICLGYSPSNDSQHYSSHGKGAWESKAALVGREGHGLAALELKFSIAIIKDQLQADRALPFLGLSVGCLAPLLVGQRAAGWWGLLEHSC